MAARDPIVLPESAEVLDQALPHTDSVVFDSGHCAQIVLDWINDGYQTV